MDVSANGLFNNVPALFIKTSTCFHLFLIKALTFSYSLALDKSKGKELTFSNCKFSIGFSFRESAKTLCPDLANNFTNSKPVTFLLNKTDSRLKPLDILSDFDAIKNKFEPIDKSKIQCFDMVIKDDMTLSARCEAYSSDWDSDISTVNNQKNSGTSISVASSFIDFMENTE